MFVTRTPVVPRTYAPLPVRPSKRHFFAWQPAAISPLKREAHQPQAFRPSAKCALLPLVGSAGFDLSSSSLRSLYAHAMHHQIGGVVSLFVCLLSIMLHFPTLHPRLLFSSLPPIHPPSPTASLPLWHSPSTDQSLFFPSPLLPSPSHKFRHSFLHSFFETTEDSPITPPGPAWPSPPNKTKTTMPPPPHQQHPNKLNHPSPATRTTRTSRSKKKITVS